ncbi:MAG: hypothetical protein WCI27_05375 [Candidatus Omnitrophota bacterium]
MTLEELKEGVSVLLGERIYCSESDLQFAIAFQLRSIGQRVRLEVPFQAEESRVISNGRKYLDILAIGRERIGVELKYKTDELLNYVDSDVGPLSLKAHGAQDLGLYDFWWDVHRLEKFCNTRKIDRGFAIFVTNDDSYAKKHTGKCNADQFRLHEGRIIDNESLAWGKSGLKSLGARKESFRLFGEYVIHWTAVKNNNVRFSFVILEVKMIDGDK